MDERTRRRHLALARRHVAEAEERVKNQYRIVESLKAGGADTEAAQRLLECFERNREVLLAHLTVLEHKLDWTSACQLDYSGTPLPPEYPAAADRAKRSIRIGERS